MFVAPTVPNPASKGILGAQTSTIQVSTDSVSINTFEGTHGGQDLIVAPTVPNPASKGILGAQLSVHLPKHLQGTINTASHVSQSHNGLGLR